MRVEIGIPGIAFSRSGVAVGRSDLYQSLLQGDFWPLDEESGARASALGNQTLTDNNTVGSGTGIVYPTAASFVAANTEYLSRTSEARLQLGDIAFWIGAWVNLPNKIASRIIAAKDRTSGNQREWRLRYNSGTDRFTFVVFGDGTTGQSQTVTVDISPSTDTWYFLLASHDPAEGTINLQVNNGVVASSNHTDGVFAGDGNFTIGAGNEGSLELFNGRIGPFMFGKHYIPTSIDRTFLYNNGQGREVSEMKAYNPA